MNSEQVEFLPIDFDFSQSFIEGMLDYYDFKEIISSTSSQGKTIRYEGRKTGRNVVYKFYRRDETTTSTQMMGVCEPFLQQTLEFDYLSLLSMMARISSFVCEKRIPSKKTLSSTIEIYKFMYDATKYDNLERILQNPITVFPLFVDKARFIHDSCSGKKYLPLDCPSEVISDVLLDFGKGNNDVKSPLYTFEEGKTLDRIIISDIDSSMRERVALNIIKAGMILHAFGVLHRDIKPQNMIVTPDERIKLLDFGIANRFYPSDRVAESAGLARMNLEMIGNYESSEMGSRLFVCPEAYRRSPNNKDDIFAIGINCALILTGRHPYLDAPYDDFREFTKLSPFGNKEIQRAYRAKMEKPEVIDECERKYLSFLEKHDSPLLHMIACMFHPDEMKRPNRMSIIGDRLGIKYPTLPPQYEPQEISSGPIPNDYERQFIKRLDDGLVIISNMGYEENFMGNDSLIYHPNDTLF
jgi:serine/threonine protein kinase